MDQQHDGREDAAARRVQQAQSTMYAGHEIRAKMSVLSADGEFLGTIQEIDGDEIRLRAGADSDAEHVLLPLSLVAGVEGDRVIMRGRGDNAFGMEA
jgi:hypothetical protein